MAQGIRTKYIGLHGLERGHANSSICRRLWISTPPSGWLQYTVKFVGFFYVTQKVETKALVVITLWGLLALVTVQFNFNAVKGFWFVSKKKKHPCEMSRMRKAIIHTQIIHK